MNQTRQGRRGGVSNKAKKKSSVSKKSTTMQKILLVVILILALAVFIYCATKLADWLLNNKRSNDVAKEIFETVEITETAGGVTEKVNEPDANSAYANDYYYYMTLPFMSVDFATLKAKNPDTVAWLKVPGTKVNYPIVQTTDNRFYLTHAFDRSKNAAGWTFADYRCNLQEFGRNTIIYGHNRRNNTMFSTLLNTLNRSWCANKNNTVIYLSTPKYNTMWQVFSVYTIDKNAEYLTTYFDNDDTYMSFLNNMRDRSIYKFNTELNSKDRILTLSTCAKDDNNRVVVQAKLIKLEIR